MESNQSIMPKAHYCPAQSKTVYNQIRFSHSVDVKDNKGQTASNNSNWKLLSEVLLHFQAWASMCLLK